MATATRFASTADFVKGGVEITGSDDPRRYLFSNMFEVANRSAPWERVVIAKNLEFTIECVRAEGDSPWFICGHDETALLMQGELVIQFVKPADPKLVPAAERGGAVRLAATPGGIDMGYVELARGHLALLPAGAAYCMRPHGLGVILIQSIAGELSIERWAEICQH